MRRFLNTIHSLLPSTIQGIGENIYENIPFHIRYGSAYRKTLRFLMNSQNWTIDQHEAYQLEMLRKLVHHASQNVPFYQELYKKHGINSSHLRSLEDIRRIPLINKDDLRLYREEMKAKNYSSSAFQYHTTGGSTAKPVGLYWQANRTVPMEKAFMKRQFHWIGYSLGQERVVNIRGIPPSRGQHFEIVARNQLRLSSYQMTPSIMDEYIELINDFQPRILHAYPSSALILAKHLLERNIHLPSIKTVLCGSEQVFEWHRQIIQKAFQCRVYSWYGQSEYVSLAGECEYSTDYHFYSEYGITEILRQDGVPAKPGETGEIVATGFLNFAFPLIRYRMEDLATVSKKKYCNCGRAYPRAKRIDGRIQEMIVSKNGNLVSMTAINMHDAVFDSLQQFQFYQDKPGAIIMNIVPKQGHQRQHDKAIVQALQAKVGDQFDISLCYVENVEQTIRGKTRFLIQKLPLAREWSKVNKNELYQD